MAVDFEETEAMFPRPAFIALTGTLIATDAFILLTILWDLGTNWLEFGITTVVFAAFIVIGYASRIRIRIADGMVRTSLFRRLTIPLQDIRDWRTGDIDEIKNYTGYGFKKNKYRTYVCPGVDTAFSFKAGRFVVTATSRHVDEIVRLFPARTAVPLPAMPPKEKV
ncbi:MAG: hypothetical protein WCQ63_05225 [Methanomethylophilus sp.]|mgnify:CR=1 FL=1